MSSDRLTELQIKNAKPPTDRAQVDLWDASMPGLSVRISAKGTKTFSMKCRNPAGVEQRVTLGRYPEMSLAEARKAAMQTRVRITSGEIRLSEIERHQAPIVTLTTLADEFLKRHASKNRTAAETERLLRREILKSLGARDFKTIAKSEILAILEAIIDDDKPALAVQTLAAVRKMFNWAVSRDMLDRSPCEGIALSTDATSRDRVLDDDEVAKVYLLSGGYPFGSIVKLLILSGQRRGEIAKLKWSYIDDQERTITLPASITKNKRQHTFPYGKQVESILSEIPQQNEFLFPARNRVATTFSGWSKSKAALDKICAIPSWTLHDLRRTFATNQAAIGTQVHVTEKLLNHVSGTLGGIVGVYQRHTYMEEMRTAISEWERRLEDITTRYRTQHSTTLT